jgi:hypothetical protein
MTLKMKASPMPIQTKRKTAMESLITDFIKSALERSKEMSEEEFDRTVNECHEILDRHDSAFRLMADR